MFQVKIVSYAIDPRSRTHPIVRQWIDNQGMVPVVTFYNYDDAYDWADNDPNNIGYEFAIIEPI